jgi:hypothetical protein
MNLLKMMQGAPQSTPPTPKPHKNQSTVITLIRPKGITLPPTASRQKPQKKKVEPLLEAPPRLKRSRSVMLPPRNIHTPDWCDAGSDDGAAVEIGPFDIVAAHRALEVCESRIQRGEDPGNRHPALACQADVGRLPLSPRELTLGERYGDVRIVESTPAFWPARIWDAADAQMGEDESQRLRARIDEVGDASARPRRVVSEPLPKRNRLRRVNEQTVVSIDFQRYETDVDDTDCEEF